MLIDIHHHYPSGEGGERYEEKLLAARERYAVDFICISGLGQARSQYSNSHVERLLRSLDFVIGFGFVQLGRDGPDRVRDLKGRGFRGLKFIGPPENYDARAFYPVYEEAQKLRMPCLFHTGIVARGRDDAKIGTSSARMRPVYLDSIASAFPELHLIAAHLGFPWYEEALSLMAVHDNVYCDLSAAPLYRTPSFYRREFAFPMRWERILFGTDAMAQDFGIPHDRAVHLLEALSVPEEMRRLFWGESAARLLGLSG